MCLEQAQQYHKSQYDKRHREVDFQVGDLVWLRQLHRPLASMDNKGRNKLGPCFYGPFKVLEKIGELAYHIELPAGAQLPAISHGSCQQSAMALCVLSMLAAETGEGERSIVHAVTPCVLCVRSACWRNSLHLRAQAGIA